MASTLVHEIVGEWTLVAENVRSVAIQHRRQGSIEVYLGETAPEESDAGIVIGTNTSGLPSHFSVSALTETARIWVRSFGGASIVVMSY